ncbi:MAG: S8 family serine peptidase [Gemmataceae bacterium]
MSEPGAGDDLLAGLLHGLHPDRLLAHPRATGEGVRVALIDSGVDRARLQQRQQSRGFELVPIEGAIFREDTLEPVPDEGRTSSPHGTTVADIVLSQAPRVRLYSADVFGPAGTSDVRVVIRAIRWAMDVWSAQVINLSLGIPEQRLMQVPRRQDFLRVIEEAYHRDVIVVAAAANDHPLTRSYPAVFAPPLLSVDRGDFDDPLEVAYHPRGQVEFQARARGSLGPFASQPATSWAAPHLSGVVARLLSLRPGLKPFEVKTLLYWMDQARRGAGDRPAGA